MASGTVPPVANAMILCTEVVRQENGIDLLGVGNYFWASEFPYEHSQLCVFLELTGHASRVPAYVVAVEAQSDTEVFRSPTHEIHLAAPLVVTPVVFRLQRCRFPARGLYWIQFYCQGQMLIEHRLYVGGD